MKIKSSGIVTYKLTADLILLNRSSKVSLRLFMIDKEPGELYVQDNLITAVLNEESSRELILLTCRIDAENQPKRSISLTWSQASIKLYLDEKMVQEVDPSPLLLG